MPDIYSQPIAAPKKPVPPDPVLPEGFGPAPDVQNTVYLNDYRNTIPFESYDEDVDYEWAYGSTLELDFSIYCREELPYVFTYVTDVTNLGSSLVDKDKVARLTFSDMAYKDTSEYLSIAQIAEMLRPFYADVDEISHRLVEINEKYAHLVGWLYDKGVWGQR